MRAFVLVSLFAVGLCGVLPGGYNYNGGSSFNHAGLVGPLFGSGSNQVPSVAGGQGGFSQGGSSGFPQGGSSGFPQGGSSGFPQGGSSGFPQGGSSGFPQGGSSGFPQGGSSGFPQGGSSGFPQGGSSGFPQGGSQGSPVGSPSIGSPAVAPQFGGFGGQFVDDAPVAHHEAPLVTKQFYLHSAPEDHDSIGKNKHFVLGRPQKNYRVVFIKAPSDSNANVRLSAEYAPQEEKTVIYVLSQKEHELDVNDIATPAPTQPSKPEVFFIKYKTPEEAAHAQQEIQNQYDILGGQTQVSNEGVAPVSDVSGALAPAASERQNGPGYLPPSH